MSHTQSYIQLTGGNDCNTPSPDLAVKGGAYIRKNLRVGEKITTNNINVRGTISADTVIANNISFLPLDLNPLSTGEQRQILAYQMRVNAAYQEYQVPLPNNTNNGDETLYANKIGNFHKGLPHNAVGEVDLTAYNQLLYAISTGQQSDFEAITMGNTHAKLTDPLAGLLIDLEGADGAALPEIAPPALASAERAANAVEDYWAALMRDVSFADYGTGANTDVGTGALAGIPSLSAAAATELSGLSGYNGPRNNLNQVTPALLFRTSFTGGTVGPYISQFSYLNCPFGATNVNQQIYTIDAVATKAASGLPTADFGTVYDEWLNIQNGAAPTHSLVLVNSSNRRYIINGRDLAQNVHLDVLCEAFYQAMLILYTFCPYNEGNPYNASANQAGFGTFGQPHIAGLLPDGCYKALCKQWYHKWWIHRCLRPEAYGGLLHNIKTGAVSYPGQPVHTDALNSAAVANTFAVTGTYLLPQVYPEYSPYHPSFGSGHATVSGYAVTILKAYFNGATLIPNPVKPSADGLSLETYVVGVDGPALTVEGELNKLAYNVACGRCHAGIHYRSDSDASLLLGEAYAISVLRDQRKSYAENFAGFIFNKFDGTTVTV